MLIRVRLVNTMRNYSNGGVSRDVNINTSKLLRDTTLATKELQLAKCWLKSLKKLLV